MLDQLLAFVQRPWYIFWFSAVGAEDDMRRGLVVEMEPEIILASMFAKGLILSRVLTDFDFETVGRGKGTHEGEVKAVKVGDP